ncbi:NAD(P)/FAD-dependent oxidoreductase [Salaquimonas pukyongi]|uniref:NAD(P)/FAD-dependent oxidoreductase n=1 Tax=Salaquimonas pukyongi TaxID=2712698 RepID=UPI001FCD25F7|nr:FAD-binding oxidoreductase [Salaquimonas pukyongi]
MVEKSSVKPASSRAAKGGPGKKVLVIGAGIVGVSTAIWLQRDGHDVTIVDKAGPGEATSHGNGGILASCAIVPVTGPGLLHKAPLMLFDPGQPLYLKWRYLPRLAPWLVKYLSHANAKDTKRIAASMYNIIGDSLADHQALATGTAGERYLRATDYLYLYDRRRAFEQDAFGWEIRRRHGFTWRELEGDALAEAFPGLTAPDALAISMPDHGLITDPGAYVKALARHFKEQGGAILRGTADKIAVADGRLKGVRIDGKVQPFDVAVVATGAWSQPLMAELGLKVPLETERGYHLELWNPSWTPAAPFMLASGKFVVSPMEGRIRCAGIVEFGGLEAPPSEAPFRLLESKFRKAFPGVRWERTERWMGHRPATTDSLPVIGEVETAKGVYAGFGHQHVGLTGGPKTGYLLAQLISGKKPNMDLAPYSPSRFR